MDTSTEKDVQLQRASTELLSELEGSLPRFLYSCKDGMAPTLEVPNTVRKRVRRSTTLDLIKLIEPFQEWPQLLDASLYRISSLLANAYLEYLTIFNHYRHISEKRGPTLTLPLPQAICKLLYTLCKVRGPKVISRFLDNQARLLQPLLEAFDSWSAAPISQNSEHTAMTLLWEEKYIMLLWLSHLMLTPFDLVSIASPVNHVGENIIEGIKLPQELPSIAFHIIRLCTENIHVPGKERESAVTLLVRLTLRPDMLKTGLLDAMMQWAVLILNSHESAPRSIYLPVGILSFVAGVISGAGATTIQPYLISMFQCIEHISAKATSVSSDIMSSAVARKIIIKILCAITVTALQLDDTPARSPIPSVIDYVLEDTINRLLSALADKDTPVRLAASKALSIITVKLQPLMASEVLHAVIESLSENVLWDNGSVIQSLNHDDAHNLNNVKLRERNLTAVNPLQWQGLVLTLAHLIFRRSPPPEEISTISNALIAALNFEQRAMNGATIGITVRDAACFGIWSLARRYTTKELLSVDTSEFTTSRHHKSISILQILAFELVVAATLDPSGNIRRGASAALQELVGRHPDTILHGIALVQVVDYYTIAFRNRAVTEIALQAARMHGLYWSSLMYGLLGWRGIVGSESETRKLASYVIGKMALDQKSRSIDITTVQIRGQLRRYGSQDIEKRHGALLALAAILQEIRLSGNEKHDFDSNLYLFRTWDLFESTKVLSDRDLTLSTMRPKLTIEASCSLITALALIGKRDKGRFPEASSTSLTRCIQIISISLEHNDEEIIDTISSTVKALFPLLDDDTKEDLFTSWISKLQTDESSGVRGSRNVNGYISVLGVLFDEYADHPTHQGKIIDTLITQSKMPSDVETRVAALKSLKLGVVFCGSMTESISAAIADGLDDYTIDRRGDIGSLVRIEAIDAVHTAWQQARLSKLVLHNLGSKVCRLALEKLDKVRLQAWRCLYDIWNDLGEISDLSSDFIDVAQTSSSGYYLHVLSLFTITSLRPSLLQGLISSAGTGSESILRSSRGAISTYLETLDNSQLTDFLETLLTILRDGLIIDRLVISSLEVLSFLFEIRVVYRISSTQFNWRSLYDAVQKAHYKSTNIPKLTAAVGIYMGLAFIKAARREAHLKLASMLLHPYPQVRNTASEALFICSEASLLRRVDWFRPPKELRGDVTKIQEFLRGII